MALVRPLSMATVRDVGHGLGRLVYYLDGRRRRVAIDNLRHAFPSKSSEEIAAIAQRVFAHFGAVLLELLKFAQLPVPEMSALVDVDGVERVDQAYERGR